MNNDRSPEVKTCEYCKDQFQAYLREIECEACDGDGERYEEWELGACYRKCIHCNGKGSVMYTAKRFCSDTCKQAHYEETEF